MTRGRDRPGGKKPMTTQVQNDDFDRNQSLSQTAWALQELQLFGLRAFQDEVDLRPMPEIGRAHV